MNTEKTNKMGPMDCVTPEFRVSYPALFEARSADPSKPNEKNFGMEMLFRVSGAQGTEKNVDIKDLKAAAEAACIGAWGPDKSKWGAFKHPFKKGDDPQWSGKAGYGAGIIFVRCGRKEAFGRPTVVDQNVKDIMDKTAIYPGCYCRAKIHAYTWKHPTGGKGVSFNLDMVQLVRDGEPLGGGMKAEDAFESIAVPAGETVLAAVPSAADAFAGL